MHKSAGFPGGHDLDPADKFSSDHVLSAGRQIIRYLSTQTPSCIHNAVLFGYSQSVVMGVFAGAELHQHSQTAEVLTKLLEFVEQQPISSTTLFQLCPVNGLGADYTLGIVVTGAAHLRRA